MKAIVRTHHRILMAFFLGVGLPCLVLSYLAFRGIQNDMALREREMLLTHRRLVDELRTTVASRLGHIEEAAAALISQLDLRQEAAFEGRVQAWARSQPLVETLFLWEQNSGVRLLGARRLYEPDNPRYTLSHSLKMDAFRSLERGQRLEFGRGDLTKALAVYDSIVAGTKMPVVHAEARLAAARVQRKLGRLDRAIASCSYLESHFEGVRTTYGFPVELVARQEHADCLLAATDSARALETLLDTYDRLISGRWALTASQFFLFRDRIHHSLEAFSSSLESLSQRQRLERLRSREKERVRRAQRLILWQGEGTKELAGRRDPARRRFTSDVRGEVFCLSLLPVSEPETTAGLLWDLSALHTWLLDVLTRRLRPESVPWRLVGRRGQVLSREAWPTDERVTIRAGFVGGLPPWTLELFHPDRERLALLWHSPRRVYLLAFIMIAGILGFGLALTVRAIQRELELVRLKDDFVSMVSHELRSPLTSIRQLAEMLRTGRVPSRARRQRYYDVLVQQSERLSILINNVLDFARMQARKRRFTFEVTNVASLLGELLAAFERRVRHQGFKIRKKVATDLPPIKVDRLAFSQALGNLLDNAIKYAGERREVEVTAELRGAVLCISVRDYGEGISKEEMPSLFERFYRGTRPGRVYRAGSGFGLALVNQIMEAHHGRVMVQSEPGQGSVFTLQFPALEPSSGPKASRFGWLQKRMMPMLGHRRDRRAAVQTPRPAPQAEKKRG